MKHIKVKKNYLSFLICASENRRLMIRVYWTAHSDQPAFDAFQLLQHELGVIKTWENQGISLPLKKETKAVRTGINVVLPTEPSLCA